MTVEKSELEAFSAFVTHQEGNAVSLEDALQQFREFQEKTAKLRNHIAPGVAEARSGKTRTLDTDALKAELLQRLAQENAME